MGRENYHRKHKMKTLIGPRCVKLELDPTEIFPDDPGAGTPAIVVYRGDTATYWCAIGTGETGNGYKIPVDVLRWLEEQEREVDAMFAAHEAAP